MAVRRLAFMAACLLTVAGCATMRDIAGMPAAGEPSVALKSAETRWLLILNPRFGDVPSEPEYVWVEEDKVPTTFKTFFRGKSAIIAPPEIVAKYGPPPGGGKISPRQKVPYHPEPAKADANGRVAAAGPTAGVAPPSSGAASSSPT